MEIIPAVRDSPADPPNIAIVMPAKKHSPWSPTEDKDLVRAMQNLRRSNAAQPQVPSPRKGTRTDRNRQAIKDSED